MISAEIKSLSRKHFPFYFIRRKKKTRDPKKETIINIPRAGYPSSFHRKITERSKSKEKKKKKKKKVLSERVRSRRAEGLIPSAARSRKMAESEAGDKGGG